MIDALEVLFRYAPSRVESPSGSQRWPYDIYGVSPSQVEWNISNEKFHDYFYHPDYSNMPTRNAKFNFNPKYTRVEDVPDILREERVRDVVIAGSIATPYELFEVLRSEGDRLGQKEKAPIRFHHIHLENEGGKPLYDKLPAGFEDNSLFMGGNVRVAVNKAIQGEETGADVTPINLSHVAGMLYNLPGRMAVCCMATTPDSYGNCSIVNPDIVLPGIEKALASGGPVIGFINAQAPRTYGATHVNMSKFSHVVEIDRRLPHHAPPQADEVSRQIAVNTARIIPDGASLQLGVGEIPNQVGLALVDLGRDDLSVWTETFSDAVVDLDKAGRLSNNHPLFRGKSVTSFVAGDRVIDYVDPNRDVVFLPSHIALDGMLIRVQPKMTNVLGAIEVSLMGDVCPDTIGFKIYSGAGGHACSAYNSVFSEDSRRIVTFPSTYWDKEANCLGSRIQVSLRPGAGVVTTRNFDTTFVTEYGAAKIGSESVRTRAEKMIEIAHPSFRDHLRDEWKRAVRGK